MNILKAVTLNDERKHPFFEFFRISNGFFYLSKFDSPIWKWNNQLANFFLVYGNQFWGFVISAINAISNDNFNWS